MPLNLTALILIARPLFAGAALAAAALTLDARAQLPVSGRPVAGMANFETIMGDFMTEGPVTLGKLN